MPPVVQKMFGKSSNLLRLSQQSDFTSASEIPLGSETKTRQHLQIKLRQEALWLGGWVSR
jgi:hypothetical protein